MEIGIFPGLKHFRDRFCCSLHLHISRPPFLGQLSNVRYYTLQDYLHLLTLIGSGCTAFESTRYQHRTFSDSSSLDHARSDAPSTSHLRPSPAQIVQYTRLVGPTRAVTQSGGVVAQAHTDSYYSIGFGQDLEDGHGTHTAGSAAGAALNSPATTVTCATNETLGCIGTCLSWLEEAILLTDDFPTWDTLCPQFDCDNFGDPCLSENVSATLTESGGVAQGAKISVFDASVDGVLVWASLAMNGAWESTNGTDCFLHSNSWGGDNDCTVDSQMVAYDEYMYEVSREAFVWRDTFCSLAELEAFSLNVEGRMAEGTWFQQTCG